MKLCRTARDLKKALAAFRRKNQSVGFVPTMGALHEGHLSLIRAARAENDRVVCSIFVNPIQFGPREDLKRYPRPFSRDKKILEWEKTDLLFAPAASEIYPDGFQTRVSVGPLAAPLCGKTRPAHFSGVATVVLKLLQIVQPDRIYLGQKDYQQVRVVARMVEDFNLPVQVCQVKTTREADGLAMSSRNFFLTPSERAEAPGIHRTLCRVRTAALGGVQSASRLRKILRDGLSELRRARIDYAEILDAQTLSPMVKLTRNRPAVVACALFYSKARLIDNIIIRV